MANLGGIDENSLKRAEAYNRAMKKAADSLERQRKLTGIISSELLGLDGGAFFRGLNDGEIQEKTNKLNAAIKKAKEEAKSYGDTLNTTFENMIQKSGKTPEKFLEGLQLSNKETEELNKLFDENGKLTGDVSIAIQQMGEYGKTFVERIQNSAHVSEELKGEFSGTIEKIQGANDAVSIFQKEIQNTSEQVFSLASGFNHIGQNILKGILPKIQEFDGAIKKAQIDTGINFTENTTQMAMLTSETAKFGLSIGDTATLMGDLGTELRTANFHVLSEAAGDLAAMQKATGLTAKDTAKLAREFMLFGQSAKDVAEFSEDVMNQARVYGVSGKEIMEDMAANMSKMRQMGFVGGEQSLARMALEAKRLGMSIDDVFSVAKKARNIEGAMEMAAELQLAGGSFAQIDPMQLLSAARKGPEELQKILAQMGSDIGTWDEENQKMVFDPIDVDRLNMVAEATGMSLDSLQNMIGKNAEDVRKADLFGGLGGSLDGLTEEQKAFIMNATKIGDDGKLDLTAKIDGVSDVNDLAKMNQDSIDALIDAEVEKKKTLEEQAQQNMSFKESLNALKDSFMNVFSIFQPALQFVAETLQALNNSLGGWGKLISMAAIGFGAIVFSSARAIIQGMNMAKGFQMAMKGGSFFDGIKQSFKNLNPFKKGEVTGNPIDDAIETGKKGGETGSASSESGGGLKGLAKGLKAMGTDGKTIREGIGNTALAGVGLIPMLLGIPTLLALGVVGLMKESVVRGFEAIADGMSYVGTKSTEIFKGALAMGALSLGLGLFAGAAYIMSQVDWLNVLFGVGVAALVVLGLIGLGFLLAGPQIILLAIGIGALIAAGLALMIAAGTLAAAGYLLTLAIEPLEKITEIDWSGLGGFAAAISAFGLGTVFAAVGLFAGALALAASAPLLAMSIDPLTKIAQTDWSGMAGFADSLFLLGPAMLAFGAAGLLLFNPLMLLGMTTMFIALGILGSIMQTLGPNLEQGANGIERMAEGVIKLEQAVSNLDTDKLSSLRNLAFSFATGGAGMGKMVAALSGGGEGGSERKVVHVVKLELDGKMLKEIELRDNKHRI